MSEIVTKPAVEELRGAGHYSVLAVALPRRDHGTRWLKRQRHEDLVDFAAKLDSVFTARQSNITPGRFEKMLEDREMLLDAEDRLSEVAGARYSRPEMFDIWWTWRYVRTLFRCKGDEQAAMDQMGVKPQTFARRLGRLDLAHLQRIFIANLIKEHFGQVLIATYQKALKGSTKDTELLLKALFPDMMTQHQDITVGSKRAPDFGPMNQAERQSAMASLRKQAGLKLDTSDAEPAE
jgi:hypothetical protein